MNKTEQEYTARLGDINTVSNYSNLEENPEIINFYYDECKQSCTDSLKSRDVLVRKSYYLFLFLFSVITFVAQSNFSSLFVFSIVTFAVVGIVALIFFSFKPSHYLSCSVNARSLLREDYVNSSLAEAKIALCKAFYAQEAVNEQANKRKVIGVNIALYCVCVITILTTVYFILRQF